MTISKDLFLSILAMDAYNRGYDAGIADGEGDTVVDEDGNLIDNDGLGGIDSYVGSAKIVADDTSDVAQANSFYALSYEITGANAPEGLAGKTVVSFRGTDNPGIDVWNGWRFGAGSTQNTQLQIAETFFETVNEKTIYEAGVDPVSDLVITGQSLGGGLAGYIASLSHSEAFLVDHEPFGAAVLVEWVKEVQRHGPYTYAEVRAMLAGEQALPAGIAAPDFSKISAQYEGAGAEKVA